MRILVIEDEHNIAGSIKKGLEQESYAVDVSFDGESGFDMAVSEDYDLIILDLMLPKMDGITVCKKLRNEENIQTPILMLTAKGEIEDKVDGLNSGADDYLSKPFAFSELLARIRALTRRPKQTLNPTLKIDNLTLNSITYEVKRNKKSINLTKTEFSLLEFLMRHKGRVLTKEQIMGHVWAYDSDILPNTIEVYIGYLRKKIDEPFPKEKQLINTLRGFGYRIGD